MNALEGRLGPGVLAHVLQYLALHGAAGRLSARCEAGDGVVGPGHVFLGQGRVAHAELDGLLGVAALDRMLAWERGAFAFEVGVTSPRITVDLPVERVLLTLSVARDGVAGRGADGGGAGAALATQGSTWTPAALGSLAADGTAAPMFLVASPLVDPGVIPGLVWAAVAVAGPIGEIFVTESFEEIGHSPRLLPEEQLGVLVQVVAGRFRAPRGRQEFLTWAEAVLAHHGYGRVEG